MTVTLTKYLTEAEEKQLMTCVRQYQGILAQRDYAWMCLLRQTGIRVGSLAGLTVADAQAALQTGKLEINNNNAKRGCGYAVTLNTRARKALRELLRIRRAQGHAQLPESPLVMSRQAGRGLAIRTFQHRLRSWGQKAGLGVDVTPHWFRHTLAKRLVARSTAREPLLIVNHVLGHHSMKSTLVYTRPDRDDVAEALQQAS